MAKAQVTATTIAKSQVVLALPAPTPPVALIEQHRVSAATHKAMVGNKCKNTKPELLVRRALREAGLPGYRLQWKKAPGRPDIAYPGRHIAIYIDGCFWHRCPYCNLPLPKSNTAYWRAKFERNVERDRRDTALALEQGWTVIRIWECELKKDKCEATIAKLVEQVRKAGASTTTYAQVDLDGQGEDADV